jgi:hypothetical protein
VSSHAVESSDVPVLRWLDLGLLALALPVFLLAGLPLLGWGAAAAAWIVQRAIHEAVVRRARASKDPKTVAGLMTASMLGRAWLVALAVFGAGMVEREAGLTAAILSILLFTTYFTTGIAGGRA